MQVQHAEEYHILAVSVSMYLVIQGNVLYRQPHKRHLLECKHEEGERCQSPYQCVLQNYLLYIREQ